MKREEFPDAGAIASSIVDLDGFDGLLIFANRKDWESFGESCESLVTGGATKRAVTAIVFPSVALGLPIGERGIPPDIIFGSTLHCGTSDCCRNGKSPVIETATILRERWHANQFSPWLATRIATISMHQRKIVTWIVTQLVP